VRANLFERVAAGTARCGLSVAAVALLVASWAGVARADGGGGGLPELNPGAAGAALTLLAGGLMLVREHLRSR
jgi:hypothetical protein